MSVPTEESRSARNELMRLSQILLPFAIHGLATLGVADALAAGPRPVEDIAADAGAETDALYRALRFTASRGLFTESPGRVFGLNPPAEFLRSDMPGSMRPRLMIDESMGAKLPLLAEILATLRTGKSASRPFQKMAANPAAAKRFSRKMQTGADRRGEALAGTVDFSTARVVADIGGGTGSILGAVLARYPQLTGVLYDMPAVVAEAPAVLDPLGVTQRCQLVGGDMFQSVPSGADTYLLSCVLHDWPDDQALSLLGNVRSVMADGSRLLAVEALVGGDDAMAAQVLERDFMLLINGGGRERTADEHAALLDRAGFRLAGVSPMGGGFSVLEATAQPGGPAPEPVASGRGQTTGE